MKTQKIFFALLFVCTASRAAPQAQPEETGSGALPREARVMAEPSTDLKTIPVNTRETPEPIKKGFDWSGSTDPDAYSIISGGSGLSLHKPMFLLPITYSPQYPGSDSEMVFQISLKQRLFGWPLYLAYTQKSFFQFLNGKESKPFRESDYNPEMFYRLVPADQEKWHHLGVDIGVEHESNGQSLPKSRSWNRIYAAPFQAAGHHLVYWKWWYRIPERDKTGPNDSGGDDNPDIQDFLGYSELHYEHQIFDKHLLHLMGRISPNTGRGAINLQYSIPSEDGGFFYALYVFHGYGESLIDYNHCITRVGLGLMLAR